MENLIEIKKVIMSMPYHQKFALVQSVRAIKDDNTKKGEWLMEILFEQYSINADEVIGLLDLFTIDDLEYTSNALKNGWWDEIHIVIWGGSTKLISEEPKMQKMIAKMLGKGVTIEACKYCSDKYKASDMLKELGVTVKYMGKPLSDYIKSDAKFITI